MRALQKKYLVGGGFATVVVLTKILSGFATAKLFSVFGGPAAMAMLGQLQNITQLTVNLAQLGLGDGVVSRVAHSRIVGNEYSKTINAAVKLSIISSVAVSIVFVCSYQFLLGGILESIQGLNFVLAFCLSLPLVILNNIIFSVMKGLQLYRKYAFYMSLQNVFTPAMVYVLVVFDEIDSALWAFVLSQPIFSLILLPEAAKSRIIKLRDFVGGLPTKITVDLLKFSSMSLIPLVLSAISLLNVRSMIFDSVGVNLAGIWQAGWYLSTVIMLGVSTILSLVYFPRINMVQGAELENEVQMVTYRLVCSLVILLLFIYAFRDFLIKSLFSYEFFDLNQVLHFQLVGDFFRGLAQVFAYLIISRRAVVPYLLAEIGFHVIFNGLTALNVAQMGVESAFLGYLIASIFYFSVLGFYSKSRFFDG